MRILVTNAHSLRNAGDRVLLEVTLEQLRANFPGSEISVAINSLQDLEGYEGTTFVGSFVSWFKVLEGDANRWHARRLPMAPWWALQAWLVAFTFRYFKRAWPMPKDPARRDLLSTYCQADFVVSCPGNFFFSGCGLGIPFLLAVCALTYGWLLGKPLYMMPQTIGPLTRRRDRWLLSGILKQMRFISLRDKPSLTAVTALGIAANRCQVLPDTAFLFRGSGDLRAFTELVAGHSGQVSDTPTSATERLLRPYVGITVIDWAAMHRQFARQPAYEQAVARAAAAFLAAHGGTIFIFPQVTGPSTAEDDRIPGARVAALLPAHKGEVIQIDKAWPPSQLRAAYGQMDLFVGTRLHSNIFALSAGTPVLAIAYQYKTHGLFEMLGLSDWVIDIEKIDDRRLTERLETLWQKRSEVKALIQLRVPPLQEEARQAVARIAGDYSRLKNDAVRR